MRPKSKVRLALASSLVVASSVSALARTLHADEPARFELVYEAPAECPTSARFVEELRFRTAKIAFGDAADVRGSLELRVTHRAGRYSGKLRLTVDGATESRSLDGPRCETVVSALGLAAAVLVDPEAKTAPAPLVIEDASPPPPEPEDASPPPEPVDAGEDAARPAPPPLAEPPAETSRFVLSGEVGVEVTSAVYEIDPLLTVGFGLGRARGARRLWQTRLSAFASGAKDVTEANGTVRYRALGGRLDACPYVLSAGPLAIEPCAFASLWIVPVSAPFAPIDRGSTRVLVTPGAFARLGLPLGGLPLALALDLGGGVHPVEERFLIIPAGEVFHVPRIYGFAGLHLVVTP